MLSAVQTDAGHRRNLPYGYAVQADGSVAADEDEQAVLLRLQLWREAGYSFRLIAASLNATDYRTRAGTEWSKSSLSWLWRSGRRAADVPLTVRSVAVGDRLYVLDMETVPSWCLRELSEAEAFVSLYVSDPAFRGRCRAVAASDSFVLKAELRSQVAAWAEEQQV